MPASFGANRATESRLEGMAANVGSPEFTGRTPEGKAPDGAAQFEAVSRLEHGGVDRGDVAIIGMSCLFPGAGNVDAYWRNILGKVDAISDPPADAWDTELYYDPDSRESDRVYCKRGGYLGALAAFDPVVHSIPPKSVGGEPDQWLSLQLAHDAMADAGYADLSAAVRQKTAVILGKGTYLNGGNAVMVQHGFMIGQTLEILKKVHPGLTADQVESLRREMKKGLPPVTPDTVPGLIPNIIVGRIANRLDLSGPAYTVDAACASSLVAVQHALRDLQAGSCDLAIVGGAQVWIPLPTLNLFCQLGALSRRQEIRPFDAAADGTLLGEGIGMLVLKRLADAERDGDRVYAVIKGVGVSSDGRGASVMAPRIEGEELSLLRAYEAAGVSPRTIGLVEAHGTATPVGDVVEVQALARVFGPRGGGPPRCAIGSVKSMISHTMPAAGVAGLIKAALALHFKILPATLNCTKPNPKLELEKTPFYVNTETRPWIHGAAEPRRAAVNAFGFGGINGHVVLEEYRGGQSAGAEPTADSGDRRNPTVPPHALPWDSEVILLEASSREELVQRAQRLSQFLDRALAGDGEWTPRLCDLAFSLAAAVRQTDGSCHLALVATSLADLKTKLERAARRLTDPTCRQIRDVSGIYFAAEPLARQGKLVFMFPGEGSQYANMLADLCWHFPEVRDCFDQSDRMYVGHPRGYVLSDFVFPRPAFTDEERRWTEQRLTALDGAVEAVLTANQAMFTLVRGLGLQPEALVGHSTGEYSAMRAAGMLGLESEERLAALGNALNDSYAAAAAHDMVPKAVLLAVGAERERVEAIAREAGGDVYVAMDNCPHQSVLVGEAAAVDRALAIVRREGLIYEYLTFDRAYHTRLFAPYAEGLQRIFAEVPLVSPQVPIYSCTTSAPYPDEPDAVRELMVEHWSEPVEFRRTIEALYDQGARLFVEVGPRGNLSTFVEDILRGKAFCAIPADVQRRSGVTQLNHLVGLLVAHGVSFDPSRLYRRRSCRRVDWESDISPVQPVRPSAPIGLLTGYPKLQISDDIAAGLRQHYVASDHVIELDVSSNHSTPIPGWPAATGIALHESTSGPSYTDPPAGYTTLASGVVTASAGDSPADTGVIDRADVPPGTTDWTAEGPMGEYFRSMDQFLATQEQIMQTFLRSTPPSEPSAWAASLPSEQTNIATSARQVSEDRGEDVGDASFYPLLGDIVSLIPGEELVAERTFDLAEDLYLRDHSFGGVVSTQDPDLFGLAVMPLTMSLEILAEAASMLLPGQAVVALRDVKASRWLAWDGGPQRLQVVARRRPGRDDEVHVQLRNLTEDAQPEAAMRTPAVEATLIFGQWYSSASHTLPTTLSDGRPSKWTPERLYTDVMFHGPAWQGVRSIQETSDGGIVAMLRTLPVTSYLASNTAPAFVLDPAVLDAAGQVIGFWTAEHLPRGHVIFPFHVEAIEICGPQQPVGQELICTASVQLVGEQQVRSNIEVGTPDGMVWYRLVGWRDKRFDVPAPLASLLRSSGGTTVSATWPEPAARLSSSTRLQCRRVATDLISDRSFWLRVWSQRILGCREREQFAALRTPQHRQVEWLAARTAAKEAIVGLLKVHYGLDLAPADVEILTDERGRPHVFGAWRQLVTVDVGVSLAHTEGHAVALVYLDEQSTSSAAGVGRRLGIDVERVHATPAGFTALTFSDHERTLLEELGGTQQEEWQLRSWCAKEAVGKALGFGLVDGPRSLSITSVDRQSEVVAVRLEGRLAEAFPDVADRPISAATLRQGDLVVAATWCDRIDVPRDGDAVAERSR